MHRSFPKPTPRLTSRETERRAVARAWQDVCRRVDVRDQWRCRCCGRRTVKTLTLCAERAEHHHLVARSQAPDRIFDVTNVVSLCCECHTKVTHHELEVVGSLNAEGPLVFRVATL